MLINNLGVVLWCCEIVWK